MKGGLYSITYAWRVFATGASFIGFGCGSLILSYLAFPIIQLITPDSHTRKLRAQHTIHLTFKVFVRFIQNIGLIHFNFMNFSALENDKGCLIISNHPTLIDYLVIISKLKHCDVFVKQQLFSNFFIKRVIHLADYIPNMQSMQILERVKNALQTGANVLLFPEGTRSVPHQPLKLQRGAANIAIRTQTPIRIVRITSTPNALSKTSKWYQVPAKKIQFWVEVGEKINPQGFLEKAGNPSSAARQLTQYLKLQLEKEIK